MNSDEFALSPNTVQLLQAGGSAIALNSPEAEAGRKIATEGFELNAEGRARLGVKIGDLLRMADGTIWKITTTHIRPHVAPVRGNRKTRRAAYKTGSAKL